MKFKKYTIEKGQHRSGIYFRPHVGITKIEYDLAFTKTCLYSISGADKFDINKLFGLSWGYHHKNSARFGWRANDKKIEISAYNYRNSKRESETLCQVDIDHIYTFEIVVLEESVTFRITNDLGATVAFKQMPKAKTFLPWGYELFPYFGGNQTAPQRIEIFMRRS